MVRVAPRSATRRPGSGRLAPSDAIARANVFTEPSKDWQSHTLFEEQMPNYGRIPNWASHVLFSVGGAACGGYAPPYALLLPDGSLLEEPKLNEGLEESLRMLVVGLDKYLRRRSEYPAAIVCSVA